MGPIESYELIGTKDKGTFEPQKSCRHVERPDNAGILSVSPPP